MYHFDEFRLLTVSQRSRLQSGDDSTDFIRSEVSARI